LTGCSAPDRRDGRALRRQFVDRPHVILALELGGNNPIVAWDGDVRADRRDRR
jgi:succinylglutamic semialdehyde dehydrogenase